MFTIDTSKKPKRIQLFLSKVDKTEIAKLKDTTDKNRTIKFHEINDLSFSIPYKIDINHKLQDNPHIKKIKERYLIKAVVGQEVEWYVIVKKRKSMTDSNSMIIECMSLPYELSFQKMIGYQATSYNCTQVTTDNLKGTRWTIGYINPEFNAMYRQFDVTSQTKLEFQYEIAKKFGGIVQFDTINRKVNIYKEEEISKYKGLWIKYGKYLQSIEEDIGIEDVCTRLYITGSDGKTINSISPTGQSYIDDFSYFIYPFERDVNRNVISHSDFMDDDLCHAILDYNELIKNNTGNFSNLLNSKKSMQEQKTTEQNKLTNLETELTIILDSIQVEQNNGNSTVTLINQRNNKQNEINQQRSVISNIDYQILQVDQNIQVLNNLLKEENNFKPEQLESLKDYIKVDEWSDDNIIEVEDLYNEGLKKLKEINSPPINLSLNIVNFLEIVEAQHDWNRLNIGDIIKIKHDKLDILVQAKITEISFNYDSSSINIAISNTERIKDNAAMFANIRAVAQKTSNDFNVKKLAWERVANNFNTRNDRLTEIPTNPIVVADGKAITHVENDDGSVNVNFKWDFPDYNVTNNNHDNIDGFILYLYSSDVNSTYVFGSVLANELMTTLTSEKRNYTFPSLPSNKYYTIGIRSYRSVDPDISSGGVLLSEIVKSAVATDDPYLPRSRVYINGDLDGKLNSVMRTASYTEPIVPIEGDIWDDLTGNITKQYDGFNWVSTNAANASTVANLSPSMEDVGNTIPIRSELDGKINGSITGDAQSVGGFSISDTVEPNTIPIRDENSIIQGSISGDASTVGGKSATEFVLNTQVGVANGIATLDDKSKVPVTQLQHVIDIIPIIKFGNYIGDGTLEREIVLEFEPTLVRIFTTNNEDVSVYITSNLGGYKIVQSTSFILQGDAPLLDQESLKYGSLSLLGFKTGNTTDSYANKLNVKYFWEAIKLPVVEAT